MLVTSGVVLALASVVLFAAAVPAGVARAPGRRGAGWLALMAAAPAQTVGLGLILAGAGRLPGLWLDGAALAGCVAGWVAVAVCVRADRPAVRSALAALAAVTGTLSVAVAAARTDAPVDLPWVALHVPVAVAATGVLLALGALAARRLHRSRRGGAGIVVAALLAATFVNRLPWGPMGERSFSVAAGGQPAVVQVALQVRDGGGAYTRELPVTVALPEVDAAREIVAWAAAAAALLVVIHMAVPGFVFRAAAAAGVGVASLALLALLAMLAFRLLVRTEVSVNEGELLAWLQHTVLPRLDRAVEVRGVQPLAEAATLSLASHPAAWVALTGAVVLVLGASTTWLRRQFGVVPESEDVLAASWLDRTALRLALWGLPLQAATLLTGALWAEQRFGTLVPADPRAVASLAALGTLGLALVARALLPHRLELPAWLLLAASVVCALGLIGPELGWTLPSMHGFGG
ncbi:MAG: hypothetical protein AMXMBFR64_17020 [Myxococcales bacterium]